MSKLCLAGLTFALAAGSAMAAVDPDLLNLVMPDAKMLVGMRVDQSEASPFGQYMLGEAPSYNPEFQMFMAATGFDPRRDLREVLAAGDSEIESATHGMLLARGTFQAPQILTTARALGATVSAHHGVDVLTWVGPAGQATPLSAAFLDASTLVAGNPDAVEAAIDRHIGGITFSGPLAEKARDASATNQIWFATATPVSGLLKGKLGNLSNTSPQNTLKAVSSISGGVAFGSDTVTISLTTATDTEKSAQALAESMKLLTSMMARTSGTLVEQSGPLVHITVSLSEQQAEHWFTSQQARPKKIAEAGR